MMIVGGRRKYAFRLCVISLALTMTLAVAAAEPTGTSDDATKSGARPLREVNVTTDSEPGWLPSIELEKSANKIAIDYLAAMDQGRYSDAYAFLADGNRQESLDAFSSRLRAFNARAGAVVEHRFLKITWTKNPSQAPAPGIYAAIDLASSFQNIDRHCGYIVLYQPPAGGDFKVTRDESNFMDNATARSIAERQSSAEVEKVWRTLSANCRNYPRGIPTSPNASTVPLQETDSSDIGYRTVAEAMNDLRSRPDIITNVQNGWFVAEDRSAKTVWSFPPPGHPAYPAAVKRQVVEQAKGTFLDTRIHCEAPKQACDDLVRTFEQLNNQMNAKLKGH
jgi:hypothetical protein